MDWDWIGMIEEIRGGEGDKRVDWVEQEEETRGGGNKRRENQW